MGNFLLLGGAGFIGTRLCRRLLELNDEVVVVDNLLHQVHGDSTPEVEGLPVRFFKADCADPSWLTNEVLRYAPFDCVVHLVSETGTAQSMYQAGPQTLTNIGSLAVLNDLFGLHQSSGVNLSSLHPCGELAGSGLWAKRLVLASSRAVYGDARVDLNGQVLPSREDDALAPKSVYGVTKVAQELLLSAGFSGLETCALRFQNVYGEGQSLRNPYTGVSTVFAQAALANEDIVLFSDGRMQRDFIHVDDAVEALLLAMKRDSLPFNVMNVGSGVPTTLYKLAQLIVSTAEAKSEIRVTGETLKGDVRANFADIERLTSMGFEAKVSLADGIERLVVWAEKHFSKDNLSLYEASLRELRSRGVLS